MTTTEEVTDPPVSGGVTLPQARSKPGTGGTPRLWRQVARAWRLYLALLPMFVLLGLISYYPAINGILHSFYHWNPAGKSTFAGLAHYGEMLDNSLWWQSFEHIGVIFIWSVTLAWLFPLLAAELLISLRSERAQTIFRTLLIIPFAFPLVVHVLIWGFMYDPNNGLINTVLRDVGAGGLAQNWLGNPHTALLSLIAINFPWIASLPFLIILSSLQNIPRQIFEAAALDGAGRWTRFWRIDLPILSRQFRLLLVLAIIYVLQYGVASQILTAGGPNYATNVPVLQMINTGFDQAEWGYAAALGTFLFVLTLAFSTAALLLRRSNRSNVDAAVNA